MMENARYAKLRGRIRAKYGTQESFAKAMELSPGTLSCKLRGVTDWTRSEIVRACELLSLSLEEGYAYFFE